MWAVVEDMRHPCCLLIRSNFRLGFITKADIKIDRGEHKRTLKTRCNKCVQISANKKTINCQLLVKSSVHKPLPYVVRQMIYTISAHRPKDRVWFSVYLQCDRHEFVVYAYTVSPMCVNKTSKINENCIKYNVEQEQWNTMQFDTI